MANKRDEELDALKSSKPEDEAEDQVTAAYEHINKRLESLKKGEDDDDDSEEDEKERTGKFIEGEEEESEDAEESDESKDDKDNDKDVDEEAPGDILDEEEAVGDDDDDLKNSEDDTQKTEDAKTDEEEIDPLDDVDSKEESEDTEESDESKDDSKNKAAYDDVEEDDGAKPQDDPGQARMTGKDEPDTLDDLAKEEEEETVDSEVGSRKSEDLDAADEPAFRRPERRDESYSKDSLSEYEQSNLEIPNLRHSTAGNPNVSFGDRPIIRDRGEELPRQNPFSNRYDTPPTRKSSGSKVHLLILVLIGLAVIGGTVYLLKGQFDGTGASPSPSPTEVAQATPTPVPTPSFDRAKYKIRVLNGTSTSGLAGSVSGKLKDLGYQTEKTGNAPKSDYKATEIRTKSSASGLAMQLKQDLSSDYSNASVSGELKSSDTADAEVIVGATK